VRGWCSPVVLPRADWDSFALEVLQSGTFLSVCTAATGTGHKSPSVKYGGQSHAVAGYFTRSLGVCVEDEGRRVRVEVFASFGMLQRQPFSAFCNHSRRCHPLLETVGWQAPFSFTLSYKWPRPTSVLAGIDIFAHRPGADQRGQRGGDMCGSEHGITSSQGQWHPAHSCFPSPSSFFFLFPF